MESFIIRSYRRDKNPVDYTESMELVEIDKQLPFASFDELREILKEHSRPLHAGSKNCGAKRTGRRVQQVTE